MIPLLLVVRTDELTNGRTEAMLNFTSWRRHKYGDINWHFVVDVVVSLLIMSHNGIAATKVLSNFVYLTYEICSKSIPNVYSHFRH